MENKKKFNIIRTQLYHSPCGDLILGSFGDKLCLCDWTIEKHRIAVDKRILQNLQACYEEKTVWYKLMEIPYGKTISYGELAKLLGVPKAVRAVANANGANAISIFAPCHRVIGSDHSLTGYGGGLAAKRLLLDLELNGKSLL